MIINVQASHDKKFSLEVEPTDSAVELKERVGKAQDIPAEEIRLIFSGRILKETDTVTSLKMVEGNTVHMVRTGTKKKVAASGASDASDTATSTTSTSPQSRGQPQQQPNVPLSPNSMAQMFSGMPMGGANMMNDPMVSAMISNPELMRQSIDMMAAHPQWLQTALQMNPAYQNAPPHVQQLMQRPEFIKMVLEMSWAGGMSGMGDGGTGSGGGQPPVESGNNIDGQGGNNEYIQTLGALMGTPGIALPPNTAATSNEPPEVRFQSQLQQLTEMGFYDADANIRALLATGGNVNLAIERLLQNM